MEQQQYEVLTAFLVKDISKAPGDPARRFDIGDVITADDFSMKTNVPALVAGGHLKPVAAKKATKSAATKRTTKKETS